MILKETYSWVANSHEGCFEKAEIASCDHTMHGLQGVFAKPPTYLLIPLPKKVLGFFITPAEFPSNDREWRRRRRKRT